MEKREIKFRAYDKINKRYGAESYLTIDSGGLLGYSSNIIIEQYTGLKDKNGKEIYEGDIIQRIQIITTIRTVIFYEGCFMGENHNPHPTDRFTCFPVKDGSEWEAIGNIHEKA